MQVSKKVAAHGLNVSMAVFVGFSVFGLLKYTDGGFASARSTSLPSSVLIAVLILASIVGICFFGHQLDLRNLADHRKEEARNAAEAERKGRRKPGQRT